MRALRVRALAMANERPYLRARRRIERLMCTANMSAIIQRKDVYVNAAVRRRGCAAAQG
jgi:hypothetical protein